MDINRLRWASRRGMLELDLILLPFLENVYPTLPAREQSLFEHLLESEDQDLFNWFLQKEEPQESTIQHMVQIVRNHTGKVS